MIGPAASPSNHGEKQEAVVPLDSGLTATAEPGKVDGMLHDSIETALRASPRVHNGIVGLCRRAATVVARRGNVR